MSILLHVAEKERLLSPLLVVDALSNSSTATLGEVRSYLISVLQSESELTEQEQQLIDKYRSETERIRSQINAIQTRYVGLGTCHILCYDVIQNTIVCIVTYLGSIHDGTFIALQKVNTLQLNTVSNSSSTRTRPTCMVSEHSLL
jgi:hypothetical protein